jgi:hypothetical protein
LIASLPVLSVWPMIRTVVEGFARSVCAKRSRIGRKFGSMSARPVRNDTSLGTSSLSWLSGVCVTVTPVPWVACSIVRFCSSIFFDHM